MSQQVTPPEVTKVPQRKKQTQRPATRNHTQATKPRKNRTNDPSLQATSSNYVPSRDKSQGNLGGSSSSGSYSGKPQGFGPRPSQAKRREARAKKYTNTSEAALQRATNEMGASNAGARDAARELARERGEVIRENREIAAAYNGKPSDAPIVVGRDADGNPIKMSDLGPRRPRRNSAPLNGINIRRANEEIPRDLGPFERRLRRALSVGDIARGGEFARDARPPANAAPGEQAAQGGAPQAVPAQANPEEPPVVPEISVREKHERICAELSDFTWDIPNPNPFRWWHLLCFTFVFIHFYSDNIWRKFNKEVVHLSPKFARFSENLQTAYKGYTNDFNECDYQFGQLMPNGLYRTSLLCVPISTVLLQIFKTSAISGGLILLSLFVYHYSNAHVMQIPEALFVALRNTYTSFSWLVHIACNWFVRGLGVATRIPRAWIRSYFHRVNQRWIENLRSYSWLFEGFFTVAVISLAFYGGFLLVEYIAASKYHALNELSNPIFMRHIYQPFREEFGPDIEDLIRTILWFRRPIGWFLWMLGLICYHQTAKFALLDVMHLLWLNRDRMHFRFRLTEFTDASEDLRVASAKATPLSTVSRFGMCTITRNLISETIALIFCLRLGQVDELVIDIGHVLTLLGHRIDIKTLNAADQYKRILEGSRLLDLFNIPERLAMHDIAGNDALVAWEIINARRRIFESRGGQDFQRVLQMVR